jgi:hypothetical protein
MTAILRRGDKVHIACGIDSGQTQQQCLLQANTIMAQMKREYAPLGVEVVLLTANHGVTAPVIVAIFREEES